MSTQAELAKLLEDARGVLHKIEGLAVSERNRVEDSIQHAASATASMRVDEPAPVVKSGPEPAAEPQAPVEEPVAAQEPAVEDPSIPVEEAVVPEAPAGTEAQDEPAADAPEPVRASPMQGSC